MRLFHLSNRPNLNHRIKPEIKINLKVKSRPLITFSLSPVTNAKSQSPRMMKILLRALLLGKAVPCMKPIPLQ